MSPLIAKLDDSAEDLIPAPFIVGASRSGTTLLRMMLDAHPELAIPTETHFIPEIAGLCRSDPDPSGRFIHALTTHRRWPDFHIDDSLLSREVARLTPFTIGGAFRVFYSLYAARFAKSRWGDKTPPYSAKMKLIYRLLPEARFIHVIRDGRDVALSVRGMRFGPNSIEEAAGWWVERIRKARRHVDSVPSYLEVRYEDLVLHPEETLRRICDFVRLPWSEDTLRYYQGAGARLAELDTPHPSDDGARLIGVEERQSIHRMTTRPPDPERLGRWRTEMTPAERLSFERVAGDTLRELGYEVR